MPTLKKSAVLSVAFLVRAVIAANADPQYRPPPDPQYSVLPPANTAPAGRVPHPASWYYDPYTSGSSSCPQGGDPSGPKCDVLIPPSYPIH
jgi:hypothetical protein